MKNLFLLNVIICFFLLAACKKKQETRYECSSETGCFESPDGPYRSLDECAELCAADSSANNEQTDEEDNQVNLPPHTQGTVVLNGRTYETVTIKGQTWLAENYVFPNAQTMNSSAFPIHFYYLLDDNNEEMGTLGRCQNTFLQAQNVPAGWRIATHSDWDTLIAALTPEGQPGADADEAMRRLGAVDEWKFNNTVETTDDIGFSWHPYGMAYLRIYNDDQGYQLPQGQWVQDANKDKLFRRIENGYLYVLEFSAQSNTRSYMAASDYSYGFWKGWDLALKAHTSANQNIGMNRGEVYIQDQDPYDSFVSEEWLTYYRLVKE